MSSSAWLDSAAARPSSSASASSGAWGRGAAATDALGASGSSRWDAGVQQPYTLRAVAHSLGGFLLLIHCTQRARAGRPHRINRLILLSPAGACVGASGSEVLAAPVWVWRCCWCVLATTTRAAHMHAQHVHKRTHKHTYAYVSNSLYTHQASTP
jgi:hypothetical protein